MHYRRFRRGVLFAALWSLGGLFCGSALGQRQWHQFHSTDHQPPGVVGRGQLLRGGPLAGYFQPVEVVAPKGASISLAVDGRFGEPQKASVLTGMLIGPVYRLKITGIPLREGFEVFPTIELVNRLYPPRGLEKHFPVPIHLTAEELRMAIDGKFVTRVIYLEDPNNPLPVQDRKDYQRYRDVRGIDDPLKTADRLGRPMAILRMGSRTPVADASGRFLYNTPPLTILERPAPIPDRQAGLEPRIAPEQPGKYSNPFPRLPLQPRAVQPQVAAPVYTPGRVRR